MRTFGRQALGDIAGFLKFSTLHQRHEGHQQEPPSCRHVSHAAAMKCVEPKGWEAGNPATSKNGTGTFRKKVSLPKLLQKWLDMFCQKMLEKPG
eukprot:s1648_g1.t1